MDKKLDDFKRELSIEYMRTHTRIDKIEERFIGHMDRNVSKMMEMMQEILGRLKDQDRTVLVFDGIFKKQRVQLDDHEGRISALES